MPFFVTSRGIFLTHSSELPDADVAVWFVARLVVVVLMVVLTYPEAFCRTQASINFMSFTAKKFNDSLCYRLLIFVEIENLTAILRSDVRTYTVGLCRVVNLEKHLAEFFIRNCVGIEVYKYRFNMMRKMRLDIGIDRILFLSSDISN